MASIRQSGERRDNIAAIVAFIRKNKKATRMELCSSLSLSWACVSDLVALLMEERILMESAQESNRTSIAKGRTPTLLSLNEQKYFLGVDINDSGVAITTLSISGKQIASHKWAEEPIESEAALIRSVCDKVASMLSDGENCCGIGVAMEGRRAADGGWLYPMKHGCVSISPGMFLAREFGLPVSVRHDPECVLYSVAPHPADRIAVRVDKWIGVAAMKGEKILELPLELGWIRYGGKKLQDILRNCASKGDYHEIAEALGCSVGNLTHLLGIDRCFLAGEGIEWFEELTDLFGTALRQANPNAKYEICVITDASDGAARLAMADYPFQGKIMGK